MGAGCEGGRPRWRRARPPTPFSGRKEGRGCCDARNLEGSSGASSWVLWQRGASVVRVGRQGHALLVGTAPLFWGRTQAWPSIDCLVPVSRPGRGSTGSATVLKLGDVSADH
jgi:hypothetical protein